MVAPDRTVRGKALTTYDDFSRGILAGIEQRNVSDLVPRQALVEIDERVDHAGSVVVPLDEAAVASAAKRLVEEEGIEAIALCFLNSHLNPEHERRARQIVGAQYPDLFTCSGSDVFPVRGETRRWTTAVLNCFVHSEARGYLDSVSRNLRAAGLRSEPVFFQGVGGGISRERAGDAPLALLGSGPAAGANGANALARRMGVDRVLVGDMGGAGFDTGVIVGNEVRTTKNIEIGPFLTGVNLVDVVSVGAGGGSIAWVGYAAGGPAQRVLHAGTGGARAGWHRSHGH
ncbi:hydantoinase/oxoprolinase family protein [Pseudonocardia xishanensis]|uniref:Hydantoinase/oxoprolinase-like protein n=1 Tax=Pseudonocardia xishanensis TaxID=630995 RepID=A0ABP8RTG5_9PSEU